MSIEKRLTVRLSQLTAARVRIRAEFKGVTSAEYVRALLEQDLNQGGTAEALARLNTEVSLMSALMIRELATHALGKEGARSLEEWAHGRTEQVIKETLKDLDAGY